MGIRRAGTTERKARAEQGIFQPEAFGHADAAVVQIGAAATGGGEQLVAVGVENEPLRDLAAFHQGDGDAVVRQPVDEVGGAVQRIDDPEMLDVAQRGVV